MFPKNARRNTRHPEIQGRLLEPGLSVTPERQEVSRVLRMVGDLRVRRLVVVNERKSIQIPQIRNDRDTEYKPAKK